jgi:hypothetical protein
VYWNFCFRSLTRAETVVIETITDQDAEARELAQKHLADENRPPSAFVRVWPYCAQRSVDYPDIMAEFAPEQTRPPAADAEQVLAGAKPPIWQSHHHAAMTDISDASLTQMILEERAALANVAGEG